MNPENTTSNKTVAVFTPDGIAHPVAIYRFNPEAATTVATTCYSDGANYYEYGNARTLVRTARGRYVWHLESCWDDAPRHQYEAATDLDNRPYDIDDVDRFISRFGRDEDFDRWREDIAQPLPLA